MKKAVFSTAYSKKKNLFLQVSLRYFFLHN